MSTPATFNAEAKVASRQRETHKVGSLDGSRFADRSRDRRVVAMVVGGGETEHGNLAVFKVLGELFVTQEMGNSKIVTLCIMQRVSDTSRCPGSNENVPTPKLGR